MKWSEILLPAFFMSGIVASHPDKPDTGIREYCQFDAFNASCPSGSQILIRHASYGRMKVGRCVKGDYGFIGCKTSVLRYLDQQCSGKSECQVSVPQIEAIAQPCPEDFKSYLEASYECIQVSSGSQEECHENQTIFLQSSSGHMSTLTTDGTGFGSAPCPWTITVDPGQRVELIYYNLQDGSQSAAKPRGCPLFVVVRENGKSRDFNLCEMTSREGHLFTAQTNLIQFYFISPIAQQEVPNFIVQYRGTGCADIQAPSHTWIRREGDNAIVRCNNTQETWYVTCKGNQWLGEIGNCTRAAQRYRTGSAVSHHSALPHGILMAVVIGILLGVVIGTVLLAVVFTCRRRRLFGDEKTGSLLQRPPAHDMNGTLRSNSYPKIRPAKSVDGHGTDYQFRQQSRPLIPRPDSDYSRPLGQGVTGPPPYTIHWNDGTGGPVYETHGPHHEYEIAGPDHEYESPTPVPQGADTVSFGRPVYYELDTNNPSSNRSEPGYQRALPVIDDFDTAHLSV